jgi:hypothetical protein
MTTLRRHVNLVTVRIVLVQAAGIHTVVLTQAVKPGLVTRDFIPGPRIFELVERRLGRRQLSRKDVLHYIKNLLNFYLKMEATALEYIKNWMVRNPDRTPAEAWKVWNGLSPETKAFLNGLYNRPIRI